MLGSFHTAKVIKHCIGKSLTGSGIQDVLIETEVFGVKPVESVMKGTHYVRSLRGIIITPEAIEAMKWYAFWKVTYPTWYSDIIHLSKSLRESL